MIEKVPESHLYMWLKEKDSKFLSKLDETIEYANTILPQINNVFASYTVHGVRHSINVMEYMYAITFLKIPIITEDEESEFLKAYDVLEDYQEALDKIGNYEAINIWGDEDEFEDYDFIIEESSESIIGGYTLGGFRNQFHQGSLTPVKPEIIKKGVVTGESNAVLPYNEENTFKGRFSWENTDTCYVKNVLLSGLRIKIPYLVDGVILKGAVINIFNREFIPNVSRNNISASQQEKLSYAIGKAIHLWIRDHAELSTEQKALLDVFIETKYKETNYCLR